MKTIGIFIVIIILIGAVMYATNPITDDFSEYLNKKADSNIEKYSSGTEGLAEEMMGLAKASTGTYSKSNYERTNFYIFSVFESESTVLAYGKKYLGVFKVFFKLE